MTDLQSRPYAARDYETIPTLTVDTGAAGPRYELPDPVRAAKAVLADETGLSLELRRLTPHYLDAREAYEETHYPHGDEAHEYSVARERLVHVLVAVGAYDSDAAARTAVQELTYPGGAEALVQRWVHQEHLSTVLGFGEVAQIALAVIDRIAGGASLDDLSMWELADPYLTGGGL